MRFLVTGGTGFIGWRVVRNLLDRGIPVLVAEKDVDREVLARIPGAELCPLDVADPTAVEAVMRDHAGVTHCIHLAYLMSAEVEENPRLAVEVNVLGMVNLLEATARHGLRRLVFTSSETVYGASQALYGERPVREDDYCGPQHHFFSYGVMKLLDEFLAQRYVRKHGVSVVAARPPVVFGHGRKRGSVLWAEAFASAPALGQPVTLPFPAANRDTWIYVDDCAEQLVRLALEPQLKHFAYNNGGECVSGHRLAELVRRSIPEARIEFDERGPATPLIDWQDGTRLAAEIGFTPRPLGDGIRAHVNEARAAAGLGPV